MSLACTPCSLLRHMVLNMALALDRMANTLLAGNPNETLSQRTARAALAGNRVAGFACRLIGRISRDHCAWSLTPGTIGVEIWPWSPPPPAKAEADAPR